ncbi:hypothetical protein [Diatraea saccharalis granulovirus]|uniref:Uncharacterized protein n=1 Tax=Diatraea saccharalis granulovirus TaxID=1675862 RepID=A0A0R7EYZ5_9BBAC|nr:hypothetical protein [Diatraea saccharalis granulovirus]AKN80780.1 hypothetical protein [Diatraea saccharalis granulovirus]
MASSTDDMIVLYCEMEDNLCVFKSKNEYKLEKVNIGAYKLSIEKCVDWSDNTTRVMNDSYVIIVNNVDGGGVVGILILLKDITLKKDQVVFTKPSDKSYVESK